MIKPIKPLKVLKVIKRANAKEDTNIDMNDQDHTDKGSAKQWMSEQDGKGTMNQAILDKMIEEEKANGLHGVENKKLPRLELPGADHKAKSHKEITIQEEDLTTCQQSWHGSRDEYDDYEQWETMEEDNDEMEWAEEADF